MGYRQQSLTVGACVALHNFLQIHKALQEPGFGEDAEEDGYDPWEDAYFNSLVSVGPMIAMHAIDEEEKARANMRRDRIANAMWQEYLVTHPDLV
ncbi:unnamed protein product [Mycena citricolor]|uniref:Uncharacterized protein n=1 Tax=Mycena citricolor TaxID=2018698 RepID=A0AAD2H1D4_9AGAR|nr:unnamed protein product [Mycena citricolor]